MGGTRGTRRYMQRLARVFHSMKNRSRGLWQASREHTDAPPLRPLSSRVARRQLRAALHWVGASDRPAASTPTSHPLGPFRAGWRDSSCVLAADSSSGAVGEQRSAGRRQTGRSVCGCGTHLRSHHLLREGLDLLHGTRRTLLVANAVQQLPQVDGVLTRHHLGRGSRLLLVTLRPARRWQRGKRA